MNTKKLTILTFAMALSLSLGLFIAGGAPVMAQVVDADGDGVDDAIDQCLGSDLSAATVVIDGCDSGVANPLFPSGCTISDLVANCAVGAKNHGQFVSCVSRTTNGLKRSKVISGAQKGAIQSCAAQSDIP